MLKELLHVLFLLHYQILRSNIRKSAFYLNLYSVLFVMLYFFSVKEFGGRN